jgi:uncharacterized membrane protein YeiH
VRGPNLSASNARPAVEGAGTPMQNDLSRVVVAADLAGTFLFAVEGALAAIAGGLDLLGVLVLSFATALGGGVIRDVLIGASPPSALRDWHYAATAFVAGTLAFLGHGVVQEIPGAVLIALDAAALALFAVAGAEKALAYRIPPLIAVLMGAITAVGGGTIRDVLLARVPAVLRVDIYATAAIAGTTVVVLARRAKLSPRLAGVVGALVCFLLRMVAVWQHWHLPTASDL